MDGLTFKSMSTGFDFAECIPFRKKECVFDKKVIITIKKKKKCVCVHVRVCQLGAGVVTGRDGIMGR